MPLYNVIAYNTGVYGMGETPPEYVPYEFDRNPYIIEVWEGSSVRGILSDLYHGTYRQRLNEPGTLEFRYPVDRPEAEWLDFPNQIRLRDSVGNIIEKFDIVHQGITRGPNGELEVYISADSYLHRLNDSIIIDYSARGKTIYDILTELFALRTDTGKPDPIELGYIDPVIGDLERDVDFEGRTLLYCINKLRSMAEGDFYVLPTGAIPKFVWVPTQGVDEGQIISYDRNLVSSNRHIDYSHLFTRLYAYGAFPLGLPEPGYIENNEELYGIRSAFYVDRTIEEEDTLVEVAERRLDQLSTPEVVYTVSVVDLSKRTDADFSFDQIRLGNYYRILDHQLDVNFKTRVVSARISLDDPLDIVVELSNKQRDVGDNIYVLDDKITTLETVGDTGRFGTVPIDPETDYGAQVIQVLSNLLRYDETPNPIAIEGAVGDSLKYAPGNHVHKGGVPGEAIQTCGEENSAGEDPEKYAPVDHIHQVVWLPYEEP